MTIVINQYKLVIKSFKAVIRTIPLQCEKGLC